MCLGGSLVVFGRFWQVFGRCLGGVWEGFERGFNEGFWKVFGMCLRGSWEVFGRYFGGFRICLGAN